MKTITMQIGRHDYDKEIFKGLFDRFDKEYKRRQAEDADTEKQKETGQLLTLLDEFIDKVWG